MATKSKKYDKVKAYYDLPAGNHAKWTKEMVANAVAHKWITKSEYKQITGETYPG